VVLDTVHPGPPSLAIGPEAPTSLPGEAVVVADRSVMVLQEDDSPDRGAAVAM
jgi:hypothetical protein